MPAPRARKQRKLLIICGPTATGKTSLALKLARKYNGQLISADSRQVYRGFNIGTGKDLPKGAKFEKNGAYDVGGIKIWGYDLVGSKEEFSVSKYIVFAQNALEQIWEHKQLPILVGGTGLYIKAVVDGIPTAFIPKNPELRENLKGKDTNELFESLAQLDPLRAGSMNASDKKNPRRLIRAIEIAQRKLSGIEPKKSIIKPNSVLFVGLNAPREKLLEVIEKRVEKRLEEGLLDEVEKLLSSGTSWEDQAMTALGYRQWRGYFEGRQTLEEATKNWIREERKYARRQMAWLKRNSRINWFDITDGAFAEKVEKLVKKWYNSPK